MKKNLLVIIIIIILYHFTIQNGLEKMCFERFINFEDIKRPIYKKNNTHKTLSYLGMPSGHAEVATIIFLLLYYHKYISLPIAIISIFIFSIQRVISNMHTFSQIFFGIFFGIIYFCIYAFMGAPFFIVICISILLILTIFTKIEDIIQEPIPVWVDKRMYASIKKKQNTSFYMKLLTLIINPVYQAQTVLSWKELENYLDLIVIEIKKQNIKYDAIVGIKTGGAIISDYISMKLKIPNYKIKLTKKQFNRDKKTIDTFTDLNDKILGEYKDYDILEGITDDLQNKNIILIDELVDSGNTMSEAIKYLKNDKNVNNIFPVCISFSREKYKQNFKIHHMTEHILIWPWGYDN
jgi:hypoxanthine phosphoribosyltransferase